MGNILDDWFGIEGAKAPKTPVTAASDPAAAAQYQYNSQAAKDTAKLNAIDQYGPFGSTTFQRRDDGTPLSQTVNLSPDVQAWLDSQFGAGTALQNAAQTQLGFLPTDKFQLPTSPNGRDIAARDFGAGALDYSSFADPLAGDLYQQTGVGLTQPGSTQDIASTFYDQAKSRFQPDLEAARKAKDIELARRGIPVGSEIYKDEMNRLDRSENNAYSDAARQAELAAGQEQSRQFGQNLSTAQYGGQEQGRLQSADLANRGFLGTQENQQYNRLAQALGYGSGQYQTDLSNDLLERNQPFAEAAALLGTTPTFQTPSFQGTTPTNVAAPNYLGVVNNNASNAASMYNSAVSGQQKADAAQNAAFGNLAGSIFSIFSDEDMKEDRSPADGEQVLAAFRDMPIDDYRYKDEAQASFGLPEHRTGTMAQDYAEHFPEGSDGKVIDLGDAVGKLMAAVKSLDKRTAGERRAA